ncbi:hypothetical protein FA15DRAFT_675600 [Coprinopsis marcescibilis]|uniref:Uncharacterized protein n=1 Tax=Coprinopsis marcescibilis TaxID=230819 RepID=A0A5C3KDF1_COPMA|nr:hypothetical protein FA15DRAFT_675600 [Coprinopsis marcescibilis]
MTTVFTEKSRHLPLRDPATLSDMVIKASESGDGGNLPLATRRAHGPWARRLLVALVVLTAGALGRDMYVRYVRPGGCRGIRHPDPAREVEVGKVVPVVLNPTPFISAPNGSVLNIPAPQKATPDTPSSILPASYPVPSDVTVEKCVSWDREDVDPLNAVVASIGGVSIDRGLFFVSRGERSHGWLSVYQGKEELPQGEARVDLRILEPHGHWFLDSVKVCKVKRADGSMGVGVFTPDDLVVPKNIVVRPSWWDGKFQRYHHQAPAVMMTVHLPPADASSVLNIDHLDADMPLFKQDLHLVLLRDTVKFNQLSLVTSERDVWVGHANADSLSIVAPNGKISGQFQIGSSIVLRSKRAPVQAHVDVYSGEASIEATTIDSNVHLTTSLVGLPGQEDSRYKVNASATETGRVFLDITYLPLFAHLDVGVVAGTGGARARIAENWQGRFNATTTDAKAAARDPGDKVSSLKSNSEKRIMIDPSSTDYYIHGVKFLVTSYHPSGFVNMESRGRTTLEL